MNKIVFSYKKALIIYFIVFVLVTISSFYFFIHYVNTNDVFLKNDLTCNFREKVHVSDFVYQINGTILNNYYIDTSEVGIQNVSIQYRNRYGIKVRKTFKVEVLDVTKPTIFVSNPYEIEVGSVSNLKDTIFCADDYDDYVDCSISGEYDLNKIGEYKLNIRAVDFSNNEESKNFVLKVIDKKENKINNDYTKFSDIYSKYKKKNTLIGLDISKWQGHVDYKKLKANGVSFVMLKIGGQTDIYGSFIEDKMFKENIEGALANDIMVGVYFYSYAKTVTEARAQARWVVKKIRKYNITLPIAFDWENWGEYSTFNLSFHSLNKVASSFVNEVERYNYKGILYSSKFYLDNVWYEDDYNKWLAYYTDNNDYNKDYFLWQLCSDGKIDGIDGFVDIDVMYK